MGTGGPSALETPTAFRLNGKRLVGFERKTKIKFCVSIDLFSRPVARQVFSALQSLTSVFGMGTGGPSALETLTCGAPSGIRTRDPLIKSQLLYQLS